VAQAQATLARARAAGDAAPADSDPRTLDAIFLQREVDQARAQTEALERDLAATRLVAPFDGTVVAVKVRSGDPIEPGQPVVVVSRPGKPMIRVELASRDAARLAVGQLATVQLDGADGTPLSASVAALAPAESGTGPFALLDVDWGETRPDFSAAAQVVVTLQEKENVLLVPKGAIRSAGPRRYVEYMEGTSRRTADVEVGIISGNDAEIVRGLQQGQGVLVRP
jgi:RND family efflux transporter MFP subunit